MVNGIIQILEKCFMTDPEEKNIPWVIQFA